MNATDLMNSISKSGIISFIGLTFLLPIADTFAEEVINEKAARYHEILKKRPGGGYLFDRFYNAWLDTGSLEGLKDFLSKESKKTDRSTADTLILGFFHAKQGNDELALTVFTEALKLDPINSAAWFEKAKISSRTLNFEGAIEDLEEALAGNPKADVAVEIAKLKGRLLVRSGKNGQAIAVWEKLLEAHPDDEELHEDLVELQIDEGLYDEAIAISGSLVAKTKDPYQKVLRQLRTGDIYQRIGKRDEAIKAYQESLAQTGSDTWIEKEILSQIEQVFRKQDDITGLSEYLAGVIKSNPQRTALAQRQAEVLMELKETEAAKELFGDLLARTPGNLLLRESYIDLLRKAGEFKTAVAQMEELIKQNPDDAELLISLANLQHQAEQGKAALETLSRYLSKSDDAEYAYLRVARMQESFEQEKSAEKSYRELLVKSPDSVNAWETFASFLHRNERKDEAIAIWEKLGIDGDRDQAVRMARTLTSRQENEAAFKILEARYQDLKNDPVFLSQLCTVAIRLKKYDEAVDWAARRVQLVDQPVDMEPAVKDAATIITNSNQAISFAKQLDDKTQRSPQDNCLLAELLEREGDYEKVNTILSEESDLILSQKIRILRLREDWKAAADSTKILLARSAGRKSAFLREMVALYRRAQLPEEARRWIPEWKTVSPGSTEPWVVEASMLREEGKPDAATEILRIAARKFEDDVDIRNELASRYVEVGKSDDARRIYLNLFENSDQLSDKIRWIGQIASIARNDGKMDQLIDEFRERRRNNRQSIAPLLALAEIHRSNGEYEERRLALLEASRLKPKDVNFILEIARIEESEGDWEAALKSLNRARSIDDSPKIQVRIAAMHLRNGDEEEGYRIVKELGGKASDVEVFLKLADAIASRRDWGRLDSFLSSRIEEFRSDYRIHYLQGITLEELGENNAAADAYLRVLSIDKELASKKIKTKTSLNPYSKSAPPGYGKYINFLNSNYQAYQYGSGRSSYTYSPSRIQMSSGTIGLPATLDLAHGYALAHLAQLRVLLDESELTALQEAVQNAAGQDAAILYQLDFDRSQYRLHIGTELLDKYPDNLPLHFLWVSRIQHIGTGEMKYIKRCFKLFEKDYPSYSVHVGLAAVKVDPEAGKVLFDKSMALLKNVTEPDVSCLQAIDTILQAQTNRGIELSEKHETMLRQKLIELYPKASKINSQYSARIFWSIASAMALGDDPKSYVDFLEKKIADYKKESKHQANPYNSYSNNNNLIQPFRFPPISLPEYPYEVLILLQDPNHPYVGFRGIEPDVDQFQQFFKEAKDPILKLLLGLRARLEPEELAPIVEAIKKDRSIDPLASTQLLAGWHAREGDYKKVVQIIEQSRFLPMSRKLRRSFDAALVHAATELDLTDATNNSLVEAGKGAVLRLAYTRLLRNELITAMASLGMEAAAEKEEMKVPTAPVSNRSTSFSYSSSQSRDRIQQLIDSGKRDSALRETINQIKSLSLQALSGQNSNWRYYSRDLLRSIENHQMADELLAAFEKESTKSTSKLLEYAVAALIINDEKRAIEVFQKVVTAQPHASVARIILASLHLKKGGDEALPLIEKMDGMEVAKLASWVLYDLNYVSTLPLDVELTALESLIPLLGKIDDRSAMTWTWPVDAMQRLVQNRSASSIPLGQLYQEPAKRKKEFPKPSSPTEISNAESREKSNAQRWAVHDRYVEEMKKSAYFAAIAFECEHAGAVSRELEFDALAEARNAILQLADLKKIPQCYPQNVHNLPISSVGELVVIDAWTKKNRGLIEDQLAGELKGKRNSTSFIRRLRNLTEIYFCEPDQILTKYQSRFPQNSRSDIGLIDPTNNLFVRVAVQRKLPPELLQDLALKRARSGKMSGNNYANQEENRLVAQKLFEASPERFTSFLHELTEIYCGTKEQRAKNANSNVIERYMYFLREIAEQDGLMFATLEFIDQEGLPAEQAPNSLQDSWAYSSKEAFSQLFEGSPILAEKPEQFRVYPLATSNSDRQSIFELVLNGATHYGNEGSRKDILEWLRKKTGFGSELLAAFAGKKPDEAYEVGKSYTDDLRKLPGKRQQEIAALLQRRLGNAPVFKSNPDDPFVVWAKETFGNSSAELLEKFFTAKKPRDLQIDSIYELRIHAAHLMHSLEFSHPKKAQEVFYHAIKMGESAYRNDGYEPNFPVELLYQYTKDSNRSMDRLEVVLEILCASDPLRLDHPGFDNSYRLADTLTSHFNEFLKTSENECQNALTDTFAELYKRVGDDPLKQLVMGIDFREFVEDFSDGKVEEESVKWINSNLEGKPYSALVQQFAMSARLFAASLSEGRRKSFAAPCPPRHPLNPTSKRWFWIRPTPDISVSLWPIISINTTPVNGLIV